MKRQWPSLILFSKSWAIEQVCMSLYIVRLLLTSCSPPDTCYCLALCHYMLKQYAASLKYISEIIERGIKDHPELSVGMRTEGVDIRSVGNSLVCRYATLHLTCNTYLMRCSCAGPARDPTCRDFQSSSSYRIPTKELYIETPHTRNLFITHILYLLTVETAQDALTDMPPRSEEVHV